MQLRWYQQEAVDAAFAYWRKGGGNPLVVLPTASGKTAVSTETLRRACEGTDTRALFVAHRKELIEQTAQTMLRVWPRCPMGVYAASLGRKDIRQVTFGQTQSVYRKASSFGVIDLLVIDECHLTPPDGDGQYQQLIGGLRERNPDLRILGLTATPYRLGQGCLTWGEKKIFDSIVYSAPMKRLIEEGFLAPLVPGAVSAKVKTDGVEVASTGDFVISQLDASASDPATVASVVDDVVEWFRCGRTSALMFGVSVEHAAMMRNEMRIRGYSCEVITGETDPRERKQHIERFKRRELQCIASCDVLTTGFDAPVVDILAVVRPTMSASLWVQMAGRGMRISEGKHDCVVLDYGENTERHGPIDQIKPKPRAASKGEGNAPIKVCAACMAEAPASASLCPECDAPFPAPERKVATRASDRPIISQPEKPKEFVVTYTKFSPHISKSGSCSLKVHYDVDDAMPIAEWLCFDHEEDSFAYRKAAGWWVKAGGKRPAPSSVDEAERRLSELDKPVAITAKREGKFWRVEKVQFAKRDASAEVPIAHEPPPEYSDASWWDDADAVPF